MTAGEWDEVMAIDGRGMFLTCKFAIEAMLPTGGGAIVCLSSISGLAGQKRQAAYGPAKFIATGLTKHLAVEWADRGGIRVNAVAPGTIRTERVMRLPEEPGGSEYLAAIESMHRWAVSANRPKSPAPSSSSRPTTPPSSPAPCCRSTGGDTSRNSDGP